MKCNFKNWINYLVVSLVFVIFQNSCTNTKNETVPTAKSNVEKLYPSDVISSMSKWKILLGDGTHEDNLEGYRKDDFFYTENDGKSDWVVYKTPNSGVTSRTSSNTRTELGEKRRWLPKTGGSLSGTLKVMHVSTTGDARVAASYSTVIGQIHSDEGHENEPLKIFYKKFPGHKTGSVYWNYEINTEGDNGKRWDYSTAVWGHDMSVIGSAPNSYPAEPIDGIALGEEFTYTVNVYEGVMYLTFTSPGKPAKTFTKSLISSEYINDSDIPAQIRSLYAVIDRDGTERPNAYEGELQYFKQGNYNQTNGKTPETNMVWSSGAEIYGGDLVKQYANGSYAEVWYKESNVGPGIAPKN